jgi:ABC-type amino acid transport substrate-binding protein
MNAPHMKSSAILVVAICLTATDAEACGEVMLRSLNTMRYHAFVTHHPATIVLYSGDAAADHAPAGLAKLRDRLAKAGHKVSMVRGPDELAKALAANRYDVVIADTSDMVSVTTQLTKSSREPALIPMLSPGSDERQMRERFPRLVSGDLNDLLKAIDKAMKAFEA